jgi:hypothetical protein
MVAITVGELIQKVQELDMCFFEAGFERTDDIRFDYKINKDYKATLIIHEPSSNDEDYDND